MHTDMDDAATPVARLADAASVTHEARDPSAAASQNRLLQFLASSDAEWLASRLEQREFAAGRVLVDSVEPYTHVYFPDTAVCSIINRLPDRSVVEVGTVGNEGVVGLAVFLGDGIIPSQTIVQIPGTMRAARQTCFMAGCPTVPSFAVCSSDIPRPTSRRSAKPLRAMRGTRSSRDARAGSS